MIFDKRFRFTKHCKNLDERLFCKISDSFFKKRSNGEMHFRAQRHAYNVTGRTISSFLDMVAFVKTDR